MLFNGTEVSSGDRIANQQDSGKIVFVGVSHPNVDPFDPFTHWLISRCERNDQEQRDQDVEMFHKSCP
jgi:hypothetical protein